MAKRKALHIPKADVIVENHISIYLFRPVSAFGEQTIKDTVQDAQYFGNALCVEHRFAMGLVDVLRSQGVVVR